MFPHPMSNARLGAMIRTPRFKEVLLLDRKDYEELTDSIEVFRRVVTDVDTVDVVAEQREDFIGGPRLIAVTQLVAELVEDLFFGSGRVPLQPDGHDAPGPRYANDLHRGAALLTAVRDHPSHDHSVPGAVGVGHVVHVPHVDER